MKKKLPVFIIIFIAIFILYVYVGQQPKEVNDSDAGMIVKPAEISSESESLLDALGENIHCFDLNIEKGKDITITKWIYKDDKWHVLGEMRSDDEPYRIWVSCDEYSMDCGDIYPHGSRTESHDIPKGYFKDLEYEVNWYLSSERTVTPGQEITLMSIKAGEDVEDGPAFKEGRCDAGIAFTLTVEDR